MFSLIPQDKANHEVYGGRIAASVAVVTIVVLAVVKIVPPMFVALIAGVLAAVSGYVAGKIKEKLDAINNAKASAAGLVQPNTVEVADVQATTRGSIMVAIPLVVLALVNAALVAFK